LAKGLGVSVITIRQALGQLAREGYIRRARAKGSFVSPDVPLRQSVKFAVEVDDIVTLSETVRFRIVSREYANVPPEWEKNFPQEQSGRISRIARVRMLNEIPLEYIVSYVPYRWMSSIPENELTRLAIPRAIEAFSATRISEVKHRVAALLADDNVSDYLGVPPASPVLLNEREYLDGQETVAVSIGYYRSDLFRYEFKLTRKAYAEQG
ncbi:MAG: GntR family transcriptional regulator, partial [Candidatus Binatia bacterium]